MSPAAQQEGAVWLVGLGAYTAVGTTAVASAAAVRSGISRAGGHPSLTHGDGEPMVVAAAPCLDLSMGGVERLARLAATAVKEALEPVLKTEAAKEAVPLLLGLPLPRPGLADDLPEQMEVALHGEHFAGISLGGVDLEAEGHAAGLAGLQQALAWIRAGDHKLCLVGGVDSYLEQDTLKWLDREDLFLSGGNPHGFIPGEGAGFCLLAAEAEARRLGLPCLGQVLEAAFTREESAVSAGAVCTGQGLTAAWRAVFQAMPEDGLIHQVFCDLNGQRLRAEEMAFSLTRNRKHFAETAGVLSPADCWGDVGAASGPLLTMLASRAGSRGHSPGPHALVWASSDSGLRGAALIQPPRPAGATEPASLPQDPRR